MFYSRKYFDNAGEIILIYTFIHKTTFDIVLYVMINKESKLWVKSNS